MGKKTGSFFGIQKKKPHNASVNALITAFERQLSDSNQLLEIDKRLYSISSSLLARTNEIIVIFTMPDLLEIDKRQVSQISGTRPVL